jgi:phage terminase large subunit-like protein
VIAGKIVAGPHVRASCARHLRDLDTAAARGLVWDVDAARHVLGFFPDVLMLAGGQFEGQPFKLEPVQEFITGSLFGWKRADGTRRFRRAYIEMGKGNGKSPWAAGVGIYCLCADGEARAEVYAAASKRDQAMVLFRDAVAMREQSPALRERIVTSGGQAVWNLAHLKSGSFFKPIASDDGQSGPRPSCALCDELHEHRDSRVVDLLERGFKWRRQPLLVMITNSGSDRNSVCWEEHSHAVRVASGEVVDDTTFSYVCALDEGDDPLNEPSCWPKANPTLGAILQPDYLAGVVAQAKAIPGRLNSILRLHFCVWTDAERAWMTREALEPCMAEFDPYEEHAGKEVSVSADLSAAQDLTVLGFAVETGTKKVTREVEGQEPVTLDAPTFDMWIEAWTPGDTLAERTLRDKTPYDQWAEAGYLHAPPGRLIRLDYPAAFLANLSTEMRIKWLAYDRYAFRRFEEELANMHLTLPIIEHPQGGQKKGRMPDRIVEEHKRRGLEPPSGLWFPGSLAEFEAMILEQRVRIRINPVFVSAVMAAAMESDPYGNRWLSKRRAIYRIDAAVAAVMAAGAATLQMRMQPRAFQMLFV